MIGKQDIIRIKLGTEYRDLILHEAFKAALGGRSHVRREDERKVFLYQDQIVGIACNLAALIFARGEQDGVEEFIKVRNRQNDHCMKGDDRDFLNDPVDIKGSMIKAGSKRRLSEYNLSVRPGERRYEFAYVLALVPKIFVDGTVPEVWLMGWAWEADLPKEVDPDGIFEGSYTIMAINLRPLATFPFFVRR